MKAVYHTAILAEAALIEGFLKEHGIEARVTDALLGGAFGEIPIDTSTMPTVWVSDEDAERAEALIAEHARSRWDEGDEEEVEGD